MTWIYIIGGAVIVLFGMSLLNKVSDGNNDRQKNLGRTVQRLFVFGAVGIALAIYYAATHTSSRGSSDSTDQHLTQPTGNMPPIHVVPDSRPIDPEAAQPATNRLPVRATPAPNGMFDPDA